MNLKKKFNKQALLLKNTTIHDILKNKLKYMEKIVNIEKKIRINDQQYRNNNKLEISGIPFIDGQHSVSDCCKQLVVDVAMTADVEMAISDVDVAHRLPSAVNTVIVQFTTRTARNRLWYGKMRLKGKTVEDVGIAKPQGKAGYIFINEQFCPYNRTCLRRSNCNVISWT